MKKTISTYNPFEHENFEYKKNILDIARSQEPTLQGILTSTLIYINAVDYIASHLINNLVTITHLITHRELNATVFVDLPDQSRGLPLGDMIKTLNRYDFPDKTEFIKELGEFNSLRIKYVHNLFSRDPNELVEKIDGDLADLKALAETLIERYDTIAKGVAESWFAYLRRLPAPISNNIPIEKLEEESPVINPGQEEKKK